MQNLVNNNLQTQLKIILWPQICLGKLISTQYLSASYEAVRRKFLYGVHQKLVSLAYNYNKYHYRLG